MYLLAGAASKKGKLCNNPKWGIFKSSTTGGSPFKTVARCAPLKNTFPIMELSFPAPTLFFGVPSICHEANGAIHRVQVAVASQFS